jgi:hypothetical protein
METAADIDSHLHHKHQQRQSIFADAASTSLLMNGVQYLFTNFYHLLDWYCRLYFRLFFRQSQSSEQTKKNMGKTYADAIDTYHALWGLITLACYLFG